MPSEELGATEATAVTVMALALAGEAVEAEVVAREE